MLAYGAKKIRTPVACHQACSTCHDDNRRGRARVKRDGTGEIGRSLIAMEIDLDEFAWHDWNDPCDCAECDALRVEWRRYAGVAATVSASLSERVSP